MPPMLSTRFPTWSNGSSEASHGRGGELRLPKLGWSPTRPPSRRPTLISRPRNGARKTRRQAPCLFVFEGNELARYSLTRETEIGQDRFGLSTHVLSAQCTTRCCAW